MDIATSKKVIVVVVVLTTSLMKASWGAPPVLQVDGQPFFSLGWYCSTTSFANPGTQTGLNQNATTFLAGLRAQGINFVVPYGTDMSHANFMTAYLVGGQAAGVKVAIYVDMSAAGTIPTNPSALDPQINYCKTYPSLLGWYWTDEPDSGGMSFSFVKQVYDCIKQRDSHPTLCVHHTDIPGGADAPASWVPQGRYCDILGTDCYPVGHLNGEFADRLWDMALEAKSHSQLAEQYQLTAEIAVAQAFGGFAGWSLPTFNEQRYLSFAAVINGARGLLYYEHDNCSADYRANVISPIVQQIAGLVPAILSNSTAVSVACSRGADTTGHGIEDVSFLFGQDVTGGYLLAVNNTPGTFPVTFTLSGDVIAAVMGNQSVNIPVLYENRNVLLQATSWSRNWTLTDTFTPYDVNVYRLYTGPTPSATVQGTVAPSGYAGDLSMVGIRVEFRPIGGGTVITRKTFLNTDGTFVIPTVPRGDHDVAVKGSCWLQRVVHNVSITADSVNLGTIVLPPGDVDGDNTVTSSDLSIGLVGMNPAKN